MNKVCKLASIFALIVTISCTPVVKTAADNKDSGAGFLFVCLEDKTILLAKRSKYVDSPGLWSIFGGGAEPGESPMDTAVREGIEEAGSLPYIERMLAQTTYKKNGFVYTTFVAEVSLKEKKRWKPRLNKETEKAEWFSKLPDNLHPGLQWTLVQLMLENR